jgi:hypothetical protein
MSDYHSQTRSIPTGRADMAVDAGLRAFMLGVYNKMALGLLLSAVLAYVAATVQPVSQIVFGTPLVWVVMFGPIAILLISAFTMRNPSPVGANLVYWSVVALIGTGMGALLMYYARLPDGILTVAKAFLVTAASFGALSLWGYTTKRDISGWGTFLFMGVIGLIIAMVVNMFIASSCSPSTAATSRRRRARCACIGARCNASSGSAPRRADVGRPAPAVSTAGLATCRSGLGGVFGVRPLAPDVPAPLVGRARAACAFEAMQ